MEDLSLVDRLILRYFEDGVFCWFSSETDAYIDMLDARDEYYAKPLEPHDYKPASVRLLICRAVMLAS